MMQAPWEQEQVDTAGAESPLLLGPGPDLLSEVREVAEPTGKSPSMSRQANMILATGQAVRRYIISQRWRTPSQPKSKPEG